MGSKNSTNSRAGAGDRSNNQANRGREAVKKKLKLVTQIAGPIKVKKNVGLETGKPLYSAKGGKVNFKYGGAASKATDDYLVETKQVKVGNYFKKVGGEFIRINKSEGERLYAAGDPSISRSTIGNTKSKELKYGKSGGAMGSGDNTGIMTGIPISSEMFESQKKAKTIILGGLSLAVPGIGGSIMRAASYNYNKSTYGDYRSSFNENMSNSNFASSNQASNIQSSSDLSASNKAMGNVHPEKETASTKFTKNIGRSFSDPNAKKRSLFQTV